MKVNKLFRLIFAIIGLLVLQINLMTAQTSSNSPYSRFGIGEVVPQYNLRSASMGGISQGVQTSGVINPANPASYAAFDSLTFLFDFAASGKYTLQKSSQGTAKKGSGSINYITFGFPIVKRWRMSIGINPVTSVGYNLYDEKIEHTVKDGRAFWADGATSRIYWGNSFKISKNFFIGLNINYLFGNIDNYRMFYFPDSAYMRNLKIVNTTYVHDFTFRPGFQYVSKIKSKYKLTTGITYGFQKDINILVNQTEYTMLGGIDDDNGTDIDTIRHQTEKTKIHYPMDLIVGFTFEKPGSFLVGADVAWTDWSNYKLRGESSNLTDLWEVHIGGEFIPNHLPASKYGSRIAYRFGFRTRYKIYVLNQTNINEFVFTAGVGLPITRSKTKINLHAEAGWLGTTQNNLIQETFFKVGIGIALSEMWFFKRKYL